MNLTVHFREKHPNCSNSKENLILQLNLWTQFWINERLLIHMNGGIVIFRAVHQTDGKK